MKRIRKWALRLALNRHQRAWIWNAIIYSRNRYTRRGDYESAAIMQESSMKAETCSSTLSIPSSVEIGAVRR